MHHEAVVANKPGQTFLLSECYASIQGESSLVGTPTVFVRLYSCNLRCAWCDSVYAVEGGDYKEVSVGEVVARVQELSTPAEESRHRGISHVCWTGGEPLLQWKSVVKAIEALPPHLVHSMETDGEVDLAPFDAAVAVAATLAVVEPYSSGLGGGGFWLLHRAADGYEVMVDGRETAPSGANRELYFDRDGVPIKGATTHGGRAAAIPGTPAALAHVAPSTLGAAALALAVLSGPMAAVALRVSASRAVEAEPAAAAAAIVTAPAPHPRERFLRELMAWRGLDDEAARTRLAPALAAQKDALAAVWRGRVKRFANEGEVERLAAALQPPLAAALKQALA